MKETKPPPDASQQGEKRCRWCAGKGKLPLASSQVNCPKCGGTGKTPAVTAK